jgi:hypothetical protein
VDFSVGPYTLDPVFNPIVRLPSFKSLSLTLKLDYRFMRQFNVRLPEFQLAIRRLIEAAPNLESLDLDAPRRTLWIFLELISGISTLTHLGMSSVLNQTELSPLLTSTFKLQSLRIGEEILRETTALVLPRLLLLHGETLEKLDLKLIPFSNRDVVKLAMPQLMNLKELALRFQWYEVDFGDKIETIFPKLKKLDLHEIGCTTLKSIFTSFKTVEEMSIQSYLGTKDLNAVLIGIPSPEWTLNSIAALRSAGIPGPALELFESLTFLTADPSIRDMGSKLLFHLTKHLPFSSTP